MICLTVCHGCKCFVSGRRVGSCTWGTGLTFGLFGGGMFIAHTSRLDCVQHFANLIRNGWDLSCLLCLYLGGRDLDSWCSRGLGSSTEPTWRCSACRVRREDRSRFRAYWQALIHLSLARELNVAESQQFQPYHSVLCAQELPGCMSGIRIGDPAFHKY